MTDLLRNDAKSIYDGAIEASLPDSIVKNAVCEIPDYSGRLILVSIGKAGYQMAKVAADTLGDKIDSGIVITKYDHVKSEIKNVKCYEAGHPVLDENSINATRQALKLTDNLTKDDLVLFLVSGGGSALFEDTDCSLGELQALNKALLESGADISEINTIRKRISNVKGGRFAEHCSPATVFCVMISDVVGDKVEMIASGPACVDNASTEYALEILKKYNITISESMLELVKREAPKKLDNVISRVAGGTVQLAKNAKKIASELGYKAVIVADNITCEARELGREIAKTAELNKDTKEPLAFIYTGETVVYIKGNGMGGRNQEIALSACQYIKEIDNCVIFSVGTDGTDGPTDAAGGICDHKTYERIANSGKSPEEYLKNNDSYTALSYANDLIITGPTGTNVNDLAVLLVRPK